MKVLKFTFTRREHFCYLSVRVLLFLKNGPVLVQKQGALCLFLKEGVIDIFPSGHTVSELGKKPSILDLDEFSWMEIVFKLKESLCRIFI